MMKKTKQHVDVYTCPNAQVILLPLESVVCQTSNVSFTDLGFEELTDDGELN